MLLMKNIATRSEKMYCYAVVYQTTTNERKTKTMLGKSWTDIVNQLKGLGEDIIMAHMTLIEESETISNLADMYSTMWCSNHLRSDDMFLTL